MNVVDKIDMSEKESVAGIMAFEAQSFVRGKAKGAMKDTATGRSDVWKVPPSQLRRMKGFNMRVMTEKLKQHIRNIADSIKSEGFYQDMPLSGFVVQEDDEDVIYINGGHNRHAAIELCLEEGYPIEAVPVSIVPYGTSMIDLTVRMVTGNSGKQLTTYEKALCLKRLLGQGVSLDSAWKRLQLRTRATAEEMLTLLEAPWDLQYMVIQEQVGAELAIEYIDEYGNNALAELKKLFGRAQQAGFSKATRRHAAGANLKRAIAKSVDTMLSAVRQLRTAAIYQSLPDEVRAKLDEVFAAIETAEAEDAKVMGETPATGEASANGAGKDAAQTQGDKDQRQLDLMGDAQASGAATVAAVATEAVASTNAVGGSGEAAASTEKSGAEATANPGAEAASTSGPDASANGGTEAAAESGSGNQIAAAAPTGQAKTTPKKQVGASATKGGSKTTPIAAVKKGAPKVAAKGAGKAASKPITKKGTDKAADQDQGTSEYRREAAIATA